MKIISGGVCAAQGFKASGVHCGIRKNKTKKEDRPEFATTQIRGVFLFSIHWINQANNRQTRQRNWQF